MIEGSGSDDSLDYRQFMHGNVYSQILEACRPFYAFPLATGDASDPTLRSLPIRFEEAVARETAPDGNQVPRSVSPSPEVSLIACLLVELLE